MQHKREEEYTLPPLRASITIRDYYEREQAYLKRRRKFIEQRPTERSRELSEHLVVQDFRTLNPVYYATPETHNPDTGEVVDAYMVGNIYREGANYIIEYWHDLVLSYEVIVPPHFPLVSVIS